MNVILIGMPGVGKSTVGVLLAKALGYSFVDTDLIIQSTTGMKLSELIAEKGNASFSVTENAVLESLDVDNTVIATGGSAVLCEKGMKKLAKSGKTVYLTLPPEALEKRLTDITTRGVVMRKGETVADLAYERAPYYEKYADVTIAENGGVEDTVKAVLDALENK